jgi:hypothetical protein
MKALDDEAGVDAAAGLLGGVEAAAAPFFP